MKKSTFATLVLGIIGGLLFSLGMCMALLPEWEMFNEGVIMGAAGAVVLLITWIVHRKASGKAPVKLSFKTILKILYGIIAGIVGIVLLLCLIPMCIGFKDNKAEEN